MTFNLFKDKKFFITLISIALPIILQFLLNSSLNFLDVFMIGQLGENEVAAVGIGNQVFFVFMMVIFGIGSGVSIFSSQYWGKKDVENIKKVMRIGFLSTIVLSLLIITSILLFPKFFISLFTQDKIVIQLSKEYLVITVFSFIIFGSTIIYSMVLRSTERVVLPMIAGIIGVALNTILNYLLIFGHFGFPMMGVKGAGIATLISRGVELIIIMSVSYIRKLPSAMNPLKLFIFPFDYFKKFLYKTVPIIMQAFGWALGYSMYSMIYGHISTSSLAAYNISCSIERICLLFFNGLASACAIMVGNKIGENNEKKGFEYASNFLVLNFIVSMFISTILIIIRIPVSNIYNLSDTSQYYIANLLFSMAIILCARGFNILFHGGILKAGGDTLFSMIVDVGGIWVVGVPLAAFAGLLLKLPVHLVFLIAGTEELVKATAGFIRFFTKKWINNLTKDVEKDEKKTKKKFAFNES